MTSTLCLYKVRNSISIYRTKPKNAPALADISTPRHNPHQSPASFSDDIEEAQDIIEHPTLIRPHNEPPHDKTSSAVSYTMDIRLLRPSDIPHVQQTNITNLPENYFCKYYMYHAMSWPQLSYVAVDVRSHTVS